MIEKIVNWYQSHKSDFPWRATPVDVYHVFISEFMLQQTTTKTVESYFNNFIKRFPSIEALGNADLHDVMLYWQGLGYYRRARYLHDSAKTIYTLYDGHISCDKDTLLRLKGIGDYTASAILAIGFNYPILPIDGNIKRVFARYFGLDVPYESLKKEIEKIDLDFNGRASDFCQGVMDLANQVCKASTPLCQTCPLKENCFNYKNKANLPRKKIKYQKKILYTNALIFEEDNHIVLDLHDDKGLFPLLWNVPLSEFLPEPCAPRSGVFIEGLRHILTHIDLRINLYRVNHKPKGMLISYDDLCNFPQSSLTKKCLNSYLQTK